MIVVAILAIIATIAIPAYNGYITESRLGAARANADSLRVYLEDYFIDNGTYAIGGSPATYDKAQLDTNFGWTPDGDKGLYSYEVTATTNSWAVEVIHTASGNWIRCEDRMNKCCDSQSTGSAMPVGSCP
jgi:type IV pilus assembly protein PilE